MRTFLSALFIVSAASIVTFAGAPAASPKPPTEFTWERSTPEAQGLDSEILLAGLQRIRDEKVDVHSLIIVRHGRVVLECYVHPYDRSTLHNVKSVSKSIISAVTGIALDKGILDDLDQPVHEFFPEYFDGETGDPRKKQITLRHLLTMTSGLDLDENAPIMYGIFGSEDWIEATFARPMTADPGTQFLYSTPLTHTMSGVLSRASGRSLFELTQQHLFGPLGIESVQWKQGPQGYYFGGAELFLTPRDMAKFGMLYLDGGRWNGKQVVPADWVEASTRNRLPEKIEQLYGYWWWVQPDGGYAAMGWNGQAILVDAADELVIVATAADPNGVDKIFRGFEGYEPSDEPLPPNPQGVKALNELVQELARPTAVLAPALPEIAATVSGRKYVFEENPLGFEHLTLEFGDRKSCKLSIGLAAASFESEVGLDGRYRFTESGALGPMPENNRIALRGAWVDDKTFAIDSHEIGDPIHSRTLLSFSGDTVDVAVAVRPIDRDIHFTGKR